MAIFDDLAAEYGLQFGAPPSVPPPSGAALDETQRIPPVSPYGYTGPPPWRSPQPQQRPWPPPSAVGCPACAVRDRPQVLLHRHIDHAVALLQRQIAELEQRMSAALDNLNAQVSNLNGTLQGTVLPALAQLGAAAAATGSSTGVPEADVQAAADAVSSLTSQLAAATQQAAAQIPQHQ